MRSSQAQPSGYRKSRHLESEVCQSFTFSSVLSLPGPVVTQLTLELEAELKFPADCPPKRYAELPGRRLLSRWRQPSSTALHYMMRHAAEGTTDQRTLMGRTLAPGLKKSAQYLD